LPITRSGLGTRRQFGALLDRKPDYLEILPMAGDRISQALWTFPGTNA
jgi:hypothetical protein